MIARASLLSLAFCLLLPATGSAFAISNQLATRQTSLALSSFRRGRLTLASSRDEEIAKLEAQLRQLKEEPEAEASEESSPEVAPPAEAESTEVVTLDSDNFVGRGPAKRPVQPQQEMMSEAWKAQDDSASEGGGLTAILAGVALVLFLGFFSQIPVGQEDLTKYQAVKTSTSIDLGDINPIKGGGDF